MHRLCHRHQEQDALVESNRLDWASRQGMRADDFQMESMWALRSGTIEQVSRLHECSSCSANAGSHCTVGDLCTLSH